MHLLFDLLSLRTAFASANCLRSYLPPYRASSAVGASESPSSIGETERRHYGLHSTQDSQLPHQSEVKCCSSRGCTAHGTPAGASRRPSAQPMGLLPHMTWPSGLSIAGFCHDGIDLAA
eukprot:scaffold270_cov309-Pinguiococcus_pyrenoidosus.AAC.2